jgi:ribosomal 50S subunit-recycling heat shock protein
MRIDLFLKLSGLLRTRSIAGRACKGGFVILNGHIARASSSVSPGDTIELAKPDGDAVRVRITAIPESRQVSRKDRADLIQHLDHGGGSGAC